MRYFNIIKRNFVKLGVALLIGAYSLHTSSCANTSGAPTGGPKDTIPPVIVATLPDSQATNVPCNKTEIILTFNEYIQLKEADKNILLSPPQKKRPKTKIKGKSLVVTFPEPLDSNRTYTLNFGAALADNNEGNQIPNYAYSFSTGDYIDSMLISGTVLDYSTLLPQKGITVAVYANPQDSSVFKVLPDAVTKSDEWGYFCIRNVKPQPYAIYAFKDDNNNNLYDPGIESVGFIDSMVTPDVVMKPGLPQLASYDIKDTLSNLMRPSEMDLYIFKEKSAVQYISRYERFSHRGSFIKFNAPDVIIDSFAIRGVDSKRIIKHFNQTKDSVAFWVNIGAKLPDTLFLGIKYHKTDSLGNNVPTVENLQLVAPREKQADKRNQRQTVDQERKDLLKFDLQADPKMVEQTGFVFEFPEPLAVAKFDTLKFTTSTPRGVVTDEKFSVVQDSLNIRRYILRPDNPIKPGNDYLLKIPMAAFRDINGFTNDSLDKKIILPSDDKLSSITLEMRGVDARYIVELVNDKRDRLFRKYIITGDCELLFPYLDKGIYSIRITEDKNSNELLDPGAVLEKRQPEMVRLYKLEDGNSAITLEEKTDLIQTVDLNELFN